MRWDFAEDWRSHLGLVSVADPGVGGEITWQVSETVSIGTGIAFQSRRFRLSDKNRRTSATNPSRNDDGGIGIGIGEETEVPLFANIQWNPTPKSSPDLLAGVAFAGKSLSLMRCGRHGRRDRLGLA